MAGVNQLLPFANGETPNVIPYEDWSALAARQSGFQSGIASSQQFNYILAQGGAAGYVIGQLVADYTSETASISATPLYEAFKQALTSYVSGAPVVADGSTEPRTLEDRFADVLNVKDFGAKGDGASDDSEPIQTAMTAAAITGRNIFFPSGSYVVTQTLNCAPIVIFANNDASIVFDGLAGSDGIVFASSSSVGRYVGATGLTLICKGSNGGTCLKTAADSSQYFTYNTKYVFTNLFCRGFDRNEAGYANCWSTGFETWIDVGDCVGAFVSNLVIQGAFNIKEDPSSQLQDTGIRLSANATMLTARMQNLEIGPIYNAVLVGNNAFFSLNAFDFVGTFNGVAQEEGASPLNEPKIWGGNINCQNIGIQIENSGSRTVDFVTIRRHSSGWKGGANDWYGIKASSSSDIVISNCMIQPDESQGEFGGASWGIYAVACGAARFTGNNVGVVDVGIELDNCSDFVIDATTTLQNKATDVLFSLTNNSRLGVIGLYSTLSSFAGTVVKRDETITRAVSMLNDRFNLQSDGNVRLDLTKASAGVDEKTWRFVGSSNQLDIQAVNDAGSGTNVFLATRTGSSIDVVELRGGQVRLNGESVSNVVRPNVDDAYSLGEPSYRYTQLYAASGTINTSDVRAKSSISDPDDSTIRAWEKVSFKVFQFNESVAKKGKDLARVHVGLIAQEVVEAFESEGVDPFKLGIVCYDEWDDQYETVVVIDQEEVKDQNGNVITPSVSHTEKRKVMDAGNRYGIRYEEAFALECVCNRKRIADMQAKIEKLVEKVGGI